MFRILVVFLIGLVGSINTSSAAMLFGVSADTGNVYQIDTANPGSPVLKFSLGSGKDIAGLAYSTMRRTYFAFSRAENKIYEFNKSGKVLKVITLDRALTPGFGGPRGISFDPLGNLFVVGSSNNVYQVNLLSGKTTFRFQATGPTSEVESIALLDNAAFYAVGTPSQVLLLSRTSGELTGIGSLAAGDLDSMTGTIGGWIYMSESGSNSQLHAYNPFTEEYQNLGWTNISHLSSLEELWPNAK